MAQSAVGAIRAGCQMLSEGKAEIGKFKSQVEGGIADAKAIYKEVTGIWGWVRGLFKPTAVEKKAASPVAVATPSDAPKPVAKKTNQQPEQELSYEAYQAQAVHDICENLKIYFAAIRQLKVHCRELEEEALTTEKVADSAIDRIEMQWQMAQLSAQLKQAMIWGTPEELGLGDMYRDFLAKYDEILEEQEAARELKARRERNNAWRREHRKEILIAKLTYGVAVVVGMLEIIGLYFTL